MSIKIIRNTGFTGMAVRFAIKVNGKKVAKISHQESLELQFVEKDALLKVSQLGITSNELKVSDGDIIEIKTGKWTYIGIFLLFFSIFLSSLNVHSIYEIVALVAAIMILILTFSILNGFKLRKTNQ